LPWSLSCTICTARIGVLAVVFTARIALFWQNCAASFGSRVLARTAAMAAVLGGQNCSSGRTVLSVWEHSSASFGRWTADSLGDVGIH